MTRFEDAVFGPREVQNDEIEDFVLLRSSGLPTYQLGVVVDDIDMRITHVIRGADHLSNTPKQALLYQALGATPPIFAHVPLILGPDRTRLSKRHGATSVGSYRRKDSCPKRSAIFWRLLGWSTGDDTEFLRTAELVRAIFARRASAAPMPFSIARSSNGSTSNISRSCRSTNCCPTWRRSCDARESGGTEWGEGDAPGFQRTVDLIRPRTRLLR